MLVFVSSIFVCRHQIFGANTQIGSKLKQIMFMKTRQSMKYDVSQLDKGKKIKTVIQYVFCCEFLTTSLFLHKNFTKRDMILLVASPF